MITIELKDPYEAKILLNTFHQAFLRSYEIALMNRHQKGFVQRQIEFLRDLHSLAKKAGEGIKKDSRIDPMAVDDLVSMDGRWEKMILELSE